jgi:hypothetical protein
MPSSVDKVLELVAEYTGPPPPNAGPAELGVRSLLAMGIISSDLIPSDPAELDGLLDYLAAQCLLKRSDDAGQPDLVYEVLMGEPPEPTDATVVE